MIKYLITFLLLLPISLAQPIDFNQVTYDVREDIVNVKNIITFHLNEDVEIEISLPDSFDNFSIKSGGENIEYSFRDGKAVINIGYNTNKIIMEYSTKEFLSENSFVADFENYLPARFVFLELWLDEDYVIKNVNPEAKEVVKEDGKLKVRWQMKDIGGNELIRIVALYENRTNFGFFVMPVFALIFVIYFIINRRKT